MKIIIIEGTDNTGKNTIIQELLEQYSTATVIHCGKPTGKTNEENQIIQDAEFYDIAKKLCSNYWKTNIIILNRSWIGEFVYGVMYRNRSNSSTAMMIESIEKALLSTLNKDDIYYIQLLSNSEELISNNEDGKSLSRGDKYKINIEFNQFYTIFESSKLNKKLIYVNDGNKWRPKEDIIKEVLDFIN